MRYNWSQGSVEGHVNRLKLLKRQMYGRAGFAFLRRRVLAQMTRSSHWRDDTLVETIR
jgi:transposase